MSPKEKAEELVNKIEDYFPWDSTSTGRTPIKIALLFVKEIQKFGTQNKLREPMIF